MQVARASYQEQVSKLNIEDLVFMDETGVNIGMTRLYARAPRGQRAIGRAPRNRGKNITLLGAMGIDGIIAAMTIEGAIAKEAFQVYVNQVLVPQLRPGQVVIMDNLAVHKVKGMREAIESKGAQLLYLPPYSPDLSPIEECWSKLKQWLRSQGKRDREALEEAIAQGLKRVTETDAKGWFTHSGYLGTSI